MAKAKRYFSEWCKNNKVRGLANKLYDTWTPVIEQQFCSISAVKVEEHSEDVGDDVTHLANWPQEKIQASWIVRNPAKENQYLLLYIDKVESGWRMQIDTEDADPIFESQLKDPTELFTVFLAAKLEKGF